MKSCCKYLFVKNFPILLLLLFTLLLSACYSKEIDNKKDATIAANLQIEDIIYKTLISNETDEYKAKKIFENINLIDWSSYQSISGNNSNDLLSFLERNLSNTDDNGKLNFLRATTKLDGAYAERYSSIVGDLFLKDKRNTIHLISKLDAPKQKEIVDYILFNFSANDKLRIKKDIEQLKGLDINDDERRVVDLFLERLK